MVPSASFPPYLSKIESFFELEEAEPYPISIAKRRFPPISGCDTVIFRGGRLQSIRPENSFYEDSEILQLHASKKTVDLGDSTQADLLEGGAVVIQQQAKRGCTAAVAAMLIYDAKRPINLISLSSTNLGRTEDIVSWIKEARLLPRVTHLKAQSSSLHLLSELKKLIDRFGPAIVSTDNDIGCHVIIVDEVCLPSHSIRLRDPYHGWSISITQQAFLKGFRGGEIIQAR